MPPLTRTLGLFTITRSRFFVLRIDSMSHFKIVVDSISMGKYFAASQFDFSSFRVHSYLKTIT